MGKFKDQLIANLETIDGFEARPSPVAGGTALFFRGKEFAHFHHDQELDLKLTRKVIQSLGLVHPAGSKVHPNRAASSAWIELRIESEEAVHRVADLVRTAIAKL
ncbi:MAG: DUF5519 family protein [Rhodanobacteraceae bacterium]|nr:DUF5519 family protein [Xanthomonadales bacterium]MCP5478575.1 DUF5519 family protein [Rhodanobacteraceae bacterium]HPF73210.1 DUF5519 family protein [Xanthomonadaceae bacterium]